MSLWQSNECKIEIVDSEMILNLRQKVLRPRSSIEQCRFPEDKNPLGFHLGLFVTEKQTDLVSLPVLVSIGSFHPERSELLEAQIGVSVRPYRLRGMATDTAYAGRGYGSQILQTGENQLKEKGVDLLWFNARQVAYRFYSRLGYQFFGNEFDMPGIGPHKIMYKAIGPS